MTTKPPSGSMVWWRPRGTGRPQWYFGYVTYLGSDLIRMGAWNGDTTHGSVVDYTEIEWRER